MVKKNSMENAITIISMDIEKVNARKNLSLKENAIVAINKDTNLLNAKPRN